MAVWTSKTYSS